MDAILVAMEAKYAHEQISTIDGVKIDFAIEWVHLRKSNTEANYPHLHRSTFSRESGCFS